MGKQPQTQSEIRAEHQLIEKELQTVRKYKAQLLKRKQDLMLECSHPDLQKISEDDTSLVLKCSDCGYVQNSQHRQL